MMEIQPESMTEKIHDHRKTNERFEITLNKRGIQMARKHIKITLTSLRIRRT